MTQRKNTGVPTLFDSLVMTPEGAADPSDFLAWADARALTPLAVDCETTGLGWNDVVRTVQFGDTEQGYAVDVSEDAGCQIVRGVLHTHPGGLVFHNASFDIAKLKTVGVDPYLLWAQAADTYVIAHVLDAGRRNGLDALVRTVLGDNEDAGYKKAFRAWMRRNKFTWENVPAIALSDYGVTDTVKTALLYALLLPQLTSDEYAIVRRELEVAQLMWEYPYSRGMRLDRAYATRRSHVWGATLERDRQFFAEWYGIKNPNANAQVAAALVKDGWEPKSFTEKTGKPTLNKETLEGLRTTNLLAARLLEYKRIAKWKAAYVDNALAQADEHGYVHASYNTLGARTSRMSCSNPPLQQLPKGEGGIVRAMFIASEGNVIASVDYSQVEFRLAGHFSGDPRVRDAVLSGDWYQQVADDIGITRPQAKVFILATLYGAQPARIARSLRIDFDRADRLVSDFWASYPALDVWVRSCQSRVNNGLPLRSRWGRLLRPLGMHAAANAVIQSTAAEVMKDGLLRLRDANLMRHVVAVVHDEVVLDISEDEQHIAGEVADVLTDDTFTIPLVAEAKVYGRSWGDGYAA